MKRTAVAVAVLSFFVLALVGWACGIPPHACAIRALVGAAVLLVLVRMAGSILIDMAVDALLSRSQRNIKTKDSSGE
jgi:hypothetical protein